MIHRIALITDFGPGGPYLGQMKLRLSGLVPGIPVIDLVSDLVPFRPDLAAYLLPALAEAIPAGTLYLCVLDPGVGGTRAALAVQAGGDWYVGPDNGLLALVARRAAERRVLRIDWRPPVMSDSFHGRDLFAPVAAMLCEGKLSDSHVMGVGAMVGADWADDMACILYADGYGNLMTGLRASGLDPASVLRIGGRELGVARTFCEVPVGEAFWYRNALGLVELAVNQGRADAVLGVAPGDGLTLS